MALLAKLPDDSMPIVLPHHHITSTAWTNIAQSFKHWDNPLDMVR